MQNKLFTIEETAARFGVTVDQLKAQYKANAEGLGKLYQKALSTGRKVNGFTAEQLKQKVEEYTTLAA